MEPVTSPPWHGACSKTLLKSRCSLTRGPIYTGDNHEATHRDRDRPGRPGIAFAERHGPGAVPLGRLGRSHLGRVLRAFVLLLARLLWLVRHAVLIRELV